MRLHRLAGYNVPGPDVFREPRAALVFEGGDAIAWCQFGSPVELPNILHNGTRAMFEKAGFTFERHIGKSKTVMRKSVAPAHG